MPLVSIIMPNYNGSRYIRAAIESAIAQTFTDWELLITDDCSSDNSILIIQEYADKDARIKLLTQSYRQGVSSARNHALEESSGRYIAFLDSDDVWKPDKLECQLDFMQQNNVSFTYTFYDTIDEEGRKVGTVCPRYVKVDYARLLSMCDIGCLTVMYDSEKLGRHFFRQIKRCEDYCLWLKLLKLTPYAYCVQHVLAEYRVRPQSLSRNKLEALYYHWVVYRDIEGLSSWESLKCSIMYIINYLRRRK